MSMFILMRFLYNLRNWYILVLMFKINTILFHDRSILQNCSSAASIVFSVADESHLSVLRRVPQMLRMVGTELVPSRITTITFVTSLTMLITVMFESISTLLFVLLEFQSIGRSSAGCMWPFFGKDSSWKRYQSLNLLQSTARVICSQNREAL
ncbi:hypothetical protein P9112_000589 [Eukaryota sp. TZLM1-RC]